MSDLPVQPKRSKAKSGTIYAIDHTYGADLNIDKLAVLMSPKGYLLSAALELHGMGRLIDSLGNTLCDVQVTDKDISLYDMREWVLQGEELDKLRNALEESLSEVPSLNRKDAAKKPVSLRRVRRVRGD